MSLQHRFAREEALGELAAAGYAACEFREPHAEFAAPLAQVLAVV